MSKHGLFVMALSALTAGCAPLTWRPEVAPLPRSTAAGQAAPIAGQVYFPAPRGISNQRRAVQASIADVATAATVSLIDPDRNETQATTVTDADGQFSLDLGGRAPRSALLVVEAVKGLSSNAVGKDAVRVRTLVELRQGQWASLSSPGGGPVIISTSTTALSAIANLRQAADPIAPASLIGSLAVGRPSGSLPDTFYSESTGVSQADFAAARGLVATALLADHDPLEGLFLAGGRYDLKPGIAPETGPAIFYTRPLRAAPGETVAIWGAGFADPLSANRVAFSPGVAATPIRGSGTLIEVAVPAGARSGEVRVEAGGRAATCSFSVIPPVAGDLNP